MKKGSVHHSLFKKLTRRRNTAEMTSCTFCGCPRSVMIEAGKGKGVFICESCALVCLALFYQDDEKQKLEGVKDAGSGIRTLQD